MAWNRQAKRDALDQTASLAENGSGRTLWQEVVRRFQKNRMAVFALVVLSILLLASVATAILDIVTD